MEFDIKLKEKINNYNERFDKNFTSLVDVINDIKDNYKKLHFLESLYSSNYNPPDRNIIKVGEAIAKINMDIELYDLIKYKFRDARTISNLFLNDFVDKDLMNKDRKMFRLYNNENVIIYSRLKKNFYEYDELIDLVDKAFNSKYYLLRSIIENNFDNDKLESYILSKTYKADALILSSIFEEAKEKNKELIKYTETTINDYFDSFSDL